MTDLGAQAFLLVKFPDDKEWTMRICIPGVDDGAAVWFEAQTCDCQSKEEAEALLKVCVEKLQKKLTFLETDWV